MNADDYEKLARTGWVISFFRTRAPSTGTFVADRDQAAAVVEQFGDYRDGNRSLRCVEINAIADELVVVDLKQCCQVEMVPYEHWIAAQEWVKRHAGFLFPLGAAPQTEGTGE